MNVEVDGIIYLINVDNDENTESLANRSWFIANNKPTTPAEYTKLEKLSLIYRNKVHLGVTYSKDIETKLEKYIN